MSVRRQALGALTFVRRAPAVPFDEQEPAADPGCWRASPWTTPALYAFQQYTAEQLLLSLLPDPTGLPHL